MSSPGGFKPSPVLNSRRMNKTLKYYTERKGAFNKQRAANRGVFSNPLFKSRAVLNQTVLSPLFKTSRKLLNPLFQINKRPRLSNTYFGSIVSRRSQRSQNSRNRTIKYRK